MLNKFFTNNENLFDGLAIHADHNWQPYPVIHLDFSQMRVNTIATFHTDLVGAIKNVAKSYGIKLNPMDATSLLHELITELSKKATPFQTVVILVDEYDWPVRAHAQKNKTKSEIIEMGEFLEEFFDVLGKLKYHIRFVFMTCTTPLKLGKSTYHFNYHFTDLTFDAAYEKMIGLTQDELTSKFEHHVNAMIDEPKNETFNAMLETLRQRYDGYCFSGSGCRMYDFHSVISCLREKKVDDFWQPTREAKFNILSMYSDDSHRHRTLKSFTNLTISAHFLKMMEMEPAKYPIPMVVCMLFYGYLTFRDYNKERDEYMVDFPNDRARKEFVRELLQPIPASQMTMEKIGDKCNEMKKSLFDTKCPSFIQYLNEMAFKSRGKVSNELECVDRVIRVFQICDIESHYKREYFYGEFTAGTVDLFIDGPEGDDYRYVFEVEWNKTAGHAANELLKLIELKAFKRTFGYQRIYLMGINVADKKKGINEWIRMTYENGKLIEIKASHSHIEVEYEKIITEWNKSKVELGFVPV